MSDTHKVMQMIKEHDVKYVDFRFTDPRGEWQHLAHHVRTITEDFLNEGVMFDGSSIAGWKAHHSDHGRPDLLLGRLTRAGGRTGRDEAGQALPGTVSSRTTGTLKRQQDSRKMQRATCGLIVVLTLTAVPFSARGASSTDRQADCVAVVNPIMAGWRHLSQSNFLKPGQRIRTGDGHELAGSQVNYSRVLIGRAENACAAGQVEQARSYVKEADELLHPRPSGLMLAKRAGN